MNQNSATTIGKKSVCQMAISQKVKVQCICQLVKTRGGFVEHPSLTEVSQQSVTKNNISDNYEFGNT